MSNAKQKPKKGGGELASLPKEKLIQLCTKAMSDLKKSKQEMQELANTNENLKADLEVAN